MRINLDIQDQNLTPDARRNLIEFLHRLEKEPEKFTDVAGLQQSSAMTLAPGELEVFFRDASVGRKSISPITPQEFFASMRATVGFHTKEEAHLHVRELRDEWD